MKRKIILISIFTIIALTNMTGQSRFPERKPREENSREQNFRGQRKSFSDEELTLVQSSASDTGNGILINLVFSEPVNPQSFNSRSVRINNSPLDRSVKISFNREGTTARFTVQAELPLTIELNNIKSFDGKTLASETVTLY